MNNPTLSICINTRNRATLLAETLDSVIKQMIPNVEVIVVDGASEDNTSKVMQRYSSEYPFIRYICSEKKLGIDDGYDAAVRYATGNYCWLMTDDDLIVPGALKLVLSKIKSEHDLIILNVKCYTKNCNFDLDQQLYNFNEDKIYLRENLEVFFSDFGFGLSYIGCIVIKRNLWFENDRTPFYGTFFVHVGVIIGSSLVKSVLFSHVPLIKYRSGNSSWTARSFEIWYLKWPKLIWSFNNISIEVKNKIVVRKPWNRSLTLLKSRAMGEYDYKIFREYISFEGSWWERILPYSISRLPITPINLSLILYCLLFRKDGTYTLYNLMVSSPYPVLSEKFIRLFGLQFTYTPVNN